MAVGGPALSLVVPAGRRRARRAAPVTLAVLAGIVAAAGCATATHTAREAARAGGAGWTATFPGSVTTRGGPVSTYAATRGKETDAVTTSELLDAPSGAALRGRLRAAVHGSAAGTGGAVISQTSLRWLGHPAVDAVIATTDTLARERVTVVGRELFVVEGVSRADPPAFGGYDGVLRSFRFGA